MSRPSGTPIRQGPPRSGLALHRSRALLTLAATPAGRRQFHVAGDRRVNGHSYPQAWYEDAIGALLGEVGSLDDYTISEVVRLYGGQPRQADELTLARIAREREEASHRLTKTRDIVGWQATMARLDAEEEVTRQPQEGGRLSPREVVEYLRSLPVLWADSGPSGRQTLVTALFARTAVEGFRQMTYELTADAIALGLNAALPAEFEFAKREFGRGERSRAEPLLVIVRVAVGNIGRRLAAAG